MQTYITKTLTGVFMKALEFKEIILITLLIILIILVVFFAFKSKKRYSVVMQISDKIEIESLYLRKNERIKLPNLEEQGFEFMGWFLDKEFSIPLNIDFMPNKNIKVYAKWDKK